MFIHKSLCPKPFKDTALLYTSNGLAKKETNSKAGKQKGY